MSAKQARMNRRLLNATPELAVRHHIHQQPNFNPKFISEKELEKPEEELTQEDKEFIKNFNEDQKVLRFQSKIDPQRRLRRLSMSLRIPIAILIYHLFKRDYKLPEEKVAFTEEVTNS